MEPTTWPPTRADELKMMQTPDEWIMWPALPLKRPGTRDFGYLAEDVIDEPIKPTVWLGNIFGPMTEESDHIAYETWDELLDAGWVVD